MKRDLIILLLLLVAVSGIRGQENSPFNTNTSLENLEPPSQQTLREIETAAANPNLRYGPGEGGTPNKETPLPAGEASLAFILPLIAIYAGCLLIKRRKEHKTKSKMKHLTICLSLLMGSIFTGSSLQAQGVIKASADNFFVNPVPAGGSSISTYLDVLSNDYYADDGTISDLQVTFPKEPVKGYVQYDAASFRLEYLPMDGKVGLDSLIYQIKSKITGRTAQAVAYIHLNDKPGVISNADCFVDPEGITFDIKELATTYNLDANPNEISLPVCGDIDGDGKVEIICQNAKGGVISSWDRLQIWEVESSNGNISINLQEEISITPAQTKYPVGDIAIANVNGNKYSSIYVTLNDQATLKKFDYDELQGKYIEDWSIDYFPGGAIAFNSAPVPHITDIMGDGNLQLILASKIYNARTGILLADATDAGGNLLIDGSTSTTTKGMYSFGNFGQKSPYCPTSTLAVDIDNDGIKELIGGDCVYSVTLTNYSGSSGNTYQFLRRADQTNHPNIMDGGAAAVDIDNDGFVEILVAGGWPAGQSVSGISTVKNMYIYNPRTGKVLHKNEMLLPIGGSGPSLPFAGDIDGDGYVEFAMTGYCTLRAFKLNFATEELEEMWNLPTTDTSAATTLSMFDFAQDGKAKLIYRDETDLRIIDGRKYDDNGLPISDADRILAIFPKTFSGTLNEYPLVADVNNDGAAEIIMISRIGTPAKQSIVVYGPAGSAKWAPARQVWNQVAYNPLYVNDDLTIPSNPLSPATKFVAADGTVTRPFNNFLQQATYLNKEGTMIMEGADLTFSTRAPRRLSWQPNGDLTVTVTVANQGLVSWTHPIVLQMYVSHTTSPVTYSKVGAIHTDTNLSALAPKAERVISYTIPAALIPAEGTYDGWGITVNLDTDPGASSHVYTHGNECRDGFNNRALGFNVLDGAAIACKGALNVPVSINPAGVYNVNWYNLSGTQVASATDTYTLPKKDNNEVTKLLVQAINKTTGLPASNVRDTVYVYAAADSLVWTNDAADRDWHNPINWRKGGVSNDNYPFANIPMGCTDVTLLAGTAAYPDLKDIASGGHTDYSQYADARCANIYFDFGSELERPDLLSYDSARVETQFESHRWYMYAPPLKQTYSGDFYLNHPIPSKDLIESYTKSWGGLHPFWGSHFESSWTTIYFMPDMEYPVGYGLGVWISDKQDRDNVFFDLDFPKKDTKYPVYFEGTDQINTHITTKTLSRSSAHRFVFDGQGAGGSNINLDVEAKKAGSIVFVGNPFMAQLDFDKFQAANAGKIKAEYKILNRNNNSYLYYKKGQASQLTKEIAPMQGFLVEALVPFTQLSINGTMTASTPGKTLRAAEQTQAEALPALTLPVTVRQGNASDVAYISFGENYTATYNAQDDVMCLFDESGNSGNVRPVSIYSLSSDDVKMNLQTLPLSLLNGSCRIPLGLRTPSAETVTINVGNLSGLPEDVKMSLYDAKTMQSHPLALQSMYSFEGIQAAEGYFVKDRFFIQLDKVMTAMQDEQAEAGYLWAESRNGNMEVHSAQTMQRIEVYTLQGMRIHTAEPDAKQYSIRMEKGQVYIIKIYTPYATRTIKVIDRN